MVRVAGDALVVSLPSNRPDAAIAILSTSGS
jgi:hypothetical protein